MYIKNNRLYDNGVSFEIPQGARINIKPEGNVAIFKNEEPWYIEVNVWSGPFGDKELKEYIADLFENNDIDNLSTAQKTVNDVAMRQVCYDYVSNHHEPACSYFLNERLEIERFWMHCSVWCTVYISDPTSEKKVEDHPVISAFMNSVRKEPFEKWQDIPQSVIELREKRKNSSDGAASAGG